MSYHRWYRPPKLKVVGAFWRQVKKMVVAITMVAAMIFGLSGLGQKSLAYARNGWTAELSPEAKAAFDGRPERVTHVNTAVAVAFKQVAALGYYAVGAITFALVAVGILTYIVARKYITAIPGYLHQTIRAVRNLRRLFRFLSLRLYIRYITRHF